jgi:hypothetical protein
MEFIYTTYILERAESAGALVVNRPQGLRDMNEKVYTAWFPECCAPTLITRDMGDMAAFAQEFGKHRRQAAARHGRPLDLRGRPVRQEHAGGVRDADRLRQPLRDRPEVPAGDRRDRGFAGAAGRRRAGALRAGAHPVGQRQPRQPRGRGEGRGPAAERPGPRARRAHRACAARPRDAVRRPGRHRRLRHRDQRHQPDRHPRARPAVRARHRRPAGGGDRPAAAARMHAARRPTPIPPRRSRRPQRP